MPQAPKYLHTLEWMGNQCELIQTTYSDGNPALIVEAAGTLAPDAHPTTELFRKGEPITTLSRNFPHSGIQLDEGIFWIKDFDENIQIAHTLQTAGILEPTGLAIHSGFQIFPAMRLRLPADRIN